MTAGQESLAGVDLTNLDNFANGFPHELFRIHRRDAPVWWHEPTEHTPDGEGFWSVATHAETLAVLRDPATYSSETGGDRPYGGTLIQDLPVAGQVLNMMDDPRHGHIRRLVSSGLTPRMIRRVEDDLRRRAIALLDDVTDGRRFDFLRGIAAELPMQMICILLGIPESERHWLFDAVEPGFDYRGSRKSFEPDVDGREGAARMAAYGSALIAEKRRDPGDDMLSVVATAVVDDDDRPQLTDGELYMFFSLLFSAGAETTRNAMAGGLLALSQRPDQYLALRDDPGILATAIEEIVRWTTPSPAKRRTATRATELHGVPILARAEGRDLGRVREPRRDCLRPARRVRHPPRSQPACGVRPRHSLLSRGQPRQTRSSASCSKSCYRASGKPISSSRSSTRAATATPASAR